MLSKNSLKKSSELKNSLCFERLGKTYKPYKYQFNDNGVYLKASMLKACSLSLTSAHRGSSATFAPALVPPGRLTILKQLTSGSPTLILILNLTATKNAVKLPLLTYFMYYFANHILKTYFLDFLFSLITISQ